MLIQLFKGSIQWTTKNWCRQRASSRLADRPPLPVAALIQTLALGLANQSMNARSHSLNNSEYEQADAKNTAMLCPRPNNHDSESCPL